MEEDKMKYTAPRLEELDLAIYHVSGTPGDGASVPISFDEDQEDIGG